MQFQSDQQSIKLHIMGYEIMVIEEEPFEANWLMVRIEVHSPDARWTVTEPCLTTYEIEDLANWLEAVQFDTAAETAITFQKPLLAFRLVKEPGAPAALRVYYSLPELQIDRTGVQNGRLDFALPELNLAMAVADLRAQLKRFPPRVES